MQKPVNWNPQPYLEHFGSAEKLSQLLGIEIIKMRKQIIKKRINYDTYEFLKARYFSQTKGKNRPKPDIATSTALGLVGQRVSERQDAIDNDNYKLII